GFPGLSSILSLPDPITGRDIPADRFFAATRVDHIGVALGHFNSTDTSPDITIGNVFPSAAAIGSLPDTHTSSSKVEQVGISRHSSDRSRTTAPKRAYQSVLQTGIEFFGIFRPGLIVLFSLGMDRVGEKDHGKHQHTDFGKASLHV